MNTTALKELYGYDNPPLESLRCIKLSLVFLGRGGVSSRAFGVCIIPRWREL